MKQIKLTLLIALSIITIIIIFLTGGSTTTKSEAVEKPVERKSTTSTTFTTTTLTTTVITTTTTAKPQTIAQQVWDAMKAKGWDDEVCAGILGNMMAECGGGTLKLNPFANGDGGTSFGLCQWHNGRKIEMLKFNNKNYNTTNNLPTIEHQIDFLEHELKQYDIKLIDTNKTCKEVAYEFCVKFERPNNKYKKAEQRKQLAAIAYQEFAI